MQREDLPAGDAKPGDEREPMTAGELQAQPFSFCSGESLPLVMAEPDRRYRVVVVSPKSGATHD